MSASLQQAGVIQPAPRCLWCAARTGVPRDSQGTARDSASCWHTSNKLIPTSHRDKKAQPLWKASCWL